MRSMKTMNLKFNCHLIIFLTNTVLFSLIFKNSNAAEITSSTESPVAMENLFIGSSMTIQFAQVRKN